MPEYNHLCLTWLFRDSKSGRGDRSFPISGMLELMALKVEESIKIWPPIGTSFIDLDRFATCKYLFEDILLVTAKFDARITILACKGKT